MATVTWKQSNLKINPCILVTEKLSVERGVSYYRRDENVVTHRDGSEDATWLSQRHFKNKEEAKKADQVYSNARFRIRSKCLYTELGYLCPAANKDQLLAAVEEARGMVDEFNAGAKHCYIKFRVLCTTVDPTNRDGVEALRETLNQNTEALKTALKEFDVKKVRNMLVTTKPALELLQDPKARKALETVREEAREMAKQIAEIIREAEDNVENALISANGQEILKRVNAAWAL